MLENEEDAEKLIRFLWNCVPELTIQQEKELHKLVRKIWYAAIRSIERIATFLWKNRWLCVKL